MGLGSVARASVVVLTTAGPADPVGRGGLVLGTPSVVVRRGESVGKVVLLVIVVRGASLCRGVGASVEKVVLLASGVRV